MRGAALVAIAASIGNLLQGWDNATIAGTHPCSTTTMTDVNLVFSPIDWIFLFMNSPIQ